MQNENIKEMLQNRYNSRAYTDKYIMVYHLNNAVYFTVCDSSIVDRVTCLDKASRGNGYSLRFRPNYGHKLLLMNHNSTILCSWKFFNETVKASQYNAGDIAEKLICEHFGQEWKKNNKPFTESGDIVIDGIAYQIKFEKATFCNEATLANL